ncbi:hypothetical protein NAEGRDRAFT_47789 [Naegleria gruberi]|uniref:Uncharacterized protein AM6 n=1 Tax=Naegleria gruberi TaxID=5762 RepID=D2V986_NAEGR|nr:uncharacterized protein NAEGRDRAFT_47789 [Naegleria gruberi]EFC46545.1 hypothetical protein NAEGRDRAFT_47789 [Naegleria gruberi]|eukprot:XP_002679289.1 hypothetical protein NAEGRDRAFT_47789 [Naegleria gruberi strain NEG-M]
MGVREFTIRLFKSEDRSKTYKPLIDILPWWAVLVLFIIATVLFGIAIIVGVFAGPVVLDSHYVEMDTRKNTTTSSRGSIDFVPRTSSHLRYAQYTLDGDHDDLKPLFYGQEQVLATAPTTFSAINQEINFLCYLKSNTSTFSVESEKAFGFQKSNLQFFLQLFGKDEADGDWELIVNGTYSRPLVCTSTSELCDPITLFYESHIRHPYYRIGVSFLNSRELYDNTLIDPHFVKMEFESYNAAYSNWELGWRYSIIFITAPLCIAFIIANIIRSHFVNWATEQKWIGLLLIFLVLYNNPIFALIFTAGNWAFSFINIVFIISFVCFLMFVVLVFTDSLVIPQKDRSFLWFYIPKIVLVGILFVFVITTFTYVRLQEQEDPGYNLGIVQGLSSYQTLGIIVVLIMLVYIFVLIYYLMRVIEKHRMNLLPKRNAWRSKVIWFLTITMVIGTIVEIFLYVFSKDWNSSAQFLSYFMFYSLYVWLITILYWPSFTAVQQEEFDEENNTQAKEDDYFDEMDE